MKPDLFHMLEQAREAEAAGFPILAEAMRKIIASFLTK